jgi:outer membrane biosynthesis protein TonB
MRKLGKRGNTPSAAKQSDNLQNWPAVSQIIKVLAGFGALLFICHLGYDAAKATILRRLQAEKLALKTNGVGETREQSERLLKLNTLTKTDTAGDLALADILLGPPKPAEAAAANAKKFGRGGSIARVDHANHRWNVSKQASLKEAPIVSEKLASSNLTHSLSRPHAVHKSPAFNAQRQQPNAGEPLTPLNPMLVERNHAFLGLPALPAHRDPAAVRRVIMKHKASIQDCYTRVLKEDPGISGEIKVRLTIAPSGKVTAADLVSSTVNHANLEQLILERISRWNDFGEVSPAVGNTTFHQTFVLGEEKLAVQN